MTGAAITDIAISTVPARTIVALPGVIPTYADDGQLWDRFVPLVQPHMPPERPEQRRDPETVMVQRRPRDSAP